LLNLNQFIAGKKCKANQIYKPGIYAEVNS